MLQRSPAMLVLGACLVLPVPAPWLASPVAAQEPPGQDVATPAVPLHLAALQGNLDALRQHVAAGSDLDQLDAYGSTALIVATTFGRTEAARILVAAGADAAVGNAEGSTPLHIAAFLGRAGITEVLLAHGADPWTLNEDGALAFDMAALPAAADRRLLDELRTGLAPLGLSLEVADVDAGRATARALLRPGPDATPTVDVRPEPDGGWPVSTPAARGLDPRLVARLYADADELEAIRSLLIVRDGRLVAERYFNDGARDTPTLLQSVNKSIVSALVGIALDQGCLESVDQPILDFFPEQAGRVRDPLKREITVRHLLQMRAGYGWEGSDPTRWEGLIGGDLIPLLVDFPLDRAPGSGFDYSNMSSHLLGVIVARACDADLLDFASEHLFGPLGMEPGS